MTKTLPIHVRATRLTRKRRSLIFGKTSFTYDVRFRDGEIQINVNPNDVLIGTRFPADYHSVVRGAEAVAGDGVPGEWVDYPYGRPLRD
ncbi:hypothetical protein [Arthrobacter sp. 131MFCol6.1]|uniref:hypothetical protein n=1 Tax=Arthrobacter sp. 131MFCol6.1 TaxID=1157944 RepID=UPI0012DEF03A|nr:hypothetical protein [Arthrobacter sp. 131MFCol6.1]